MNTTLKTAMALALAIPALAGFANAQNQVARNFWKFKINSTVIQQDGDNTSKARFNTTDLIEELLFVYGLGGVKPGQCDIIAQLGDDENLVDDVVFWLAKTRGRDETWKLEIADPLLNVGQLVPEGLIVYKRDWTANNATVKISSDSSADTLNIDVPAVAFIGIGNSKAKVVGKDFFLGGMPFLNNAKWDSKGGASAIDDLFTPGVATYNAKMGGNVNNEKVLALPDITP